MNIADYITGFAPTARRLQIGSGMPKLRDGYSRAQKLIDHIASEGPIRTAELCSALDLTSRQVWGMLKHHLMTGRVFHRMGVWSCEIGKIDEWQARLSSAEAAAEAEAAALLSARGWTCLPPEAKP